MVAWCGVPECASAVFLQENGDMFTLTLRPLSRKILSKSYRIAALSVKYMHFFDQTLPYDL